MRVAVVQLHPVFGDVAANVEKAKTLIRANPADLYVLPELCFSGYTFTSKDELGAVAESSENGFSLNQMQELAIELNSGIVFGFPENDNGRFFNSAAFISPARETSIYRKLHLYCHEKDWFLPGDKPLNIIDFRGCKIGIMICFDWIFPEVGRTLALKGANIICHPANLVMHYCQESMKARSLENLVFSVTSNRIGRETRGEFDNFFTGRSQILSNRGEILYKAPSDKEEVGIADINFKISIDKRMNEKNNLWADRRPEFYQVD